MLSARRQRALIEPLALRVDASTVCQLGCALCVATTGERSMFIGRGHLKPADFERLLDSYPALERVELANWGEALLNPQLPAILECAASRGVATTIDEGANLNDVSDETLEALVVSGVRVLRVAIDGATRESYARYRVGGDLRKVIANVRRINHYKRKHGSRFPHLIMQFICFEHNTHELERALLLARMLDMEPFVKLDVFLSSLPEGLHALVEKHAGYVDREAHRAGESRHYMWKHCLEMWRSPQVNWDGKLLGCSRNIWGVYAGDVFGGDLLAAVNNERMNYARAMLRGEAPSREDIPCGSCSVYRSMREERRWIVDSDIDE